MEEWEGEGSCLGTLSRTHVFTQQDREAPPALGTVLGAPGRGAGGLGGEGGAAQGWGAASQAVEAAETGTSGVSWPGLERAHVGGPWALRLQAEATSLQ